MDSDFAIFLRRGFVSVAGAGFVWLIGCPVLLVVFGSCRSSGLSWNGGRIPGGQVGLLVAPGSFGCRRVDFASLGTRGMVCGSGVESSWMDLAGRRILPSMMGFHLVSHRGSGSSSWIRACVAVPFAGRAGFVSPIGTAAVSRRKPGVDQVAAPRIRMSNQFPSRVAPGSFRRMRHGGARPKASGGSRANCGRGVLNPETPGRLSRSERVSIGRSSGINRPGRTPQSNSSPRLAQTVWRREP